MRKPRIAPLNLQKHTIEKVFQNAWKKKCRKDGVYFDPWYLQETLDCALDRIDPQCHLDENLGELKREYKWLFETEEDYENEMQRAIEEYEMMLAIENEECFTSLEELKDMDF